MSRDIEPLIEAARRRIPSEALEDMIVLVRALARTRDDRPIPVEIQVAHIRFHRRIKLQAVLEAIERQFLYASEPGTVPDESPAELAARLEKIQGFVRAVQSGSLPPDLFTAFEDAQERLKESVDWACGELVRLRDMNERLIEALGKAQCECSLKERDSGHRIGCWKPDVDALLGSLDG